MPSPHIFEEQFMLYLSLISLSLNMMKPSTIHIKFYVRLQDWAQGFVLIVDLIDRHFTTYTIKR